MTVKLFNWILSIVIYFISFMFELLLSPLQSIGIHIPSLVSATTFLNNFWEFIFSGVRWACNALLIPPNAISLIIDIFMLKYVGKYAITLIKIAINWFWGAKDS